MAELSKDAGLKCLSCSLSMTVYKKGDSHVIAIPFLAASLPCSDLKKTLNSLSTRYQKTDFKPS